MRFAVSSGSLILAADAATAAVYDKAIHEEGTRHHQTISQTTPNPVLLVGLLVGAALLLLGVVAALVQRRRRLLAADPSFLQNAVAAVPAPVAAGSMHIAQL